MEESYLQGKRILIGYLQEFHGSKLISWANPGLVRVSARSPTNAIHGVGFAIVVDILSPPIPPLKPTLG